MLIGYLGRPGRVKHVCGEEIRFVDDGSGRLVADVKSPEAIAVLLEPYNANLFYAADEPAKLERKQAKTGDGEKEPPAEPAKRKQGRKSAAEKELIAAAATVLDNDADVVLELLASIEDAALREEMLMQEQAGQARAVVLEALG